MWALQYAVDVKEEPATDRVFPRSIAVGRLLTRWHPAPQAPTRTVEAKRNEPCASARQK
jgi:hypothetical protein